MIVLDVKLPAMYRPGTAQTLCAATTSTATSSTASSGTRYSSYYIEILDASNATRDFGDL